MTFSIAPSTENSKVVVTISPTAPSYMPSSVPTISPYFAIPTNPPVLSTPLTNSPTNIPSMSPTSNSPTSLYNVPRMGYLFRVVFLQSDMNAITYITQLMALVNNSLNQHPNFTPVNSTKVAFSFEVLSTVWLNPFPEPNTSTNAEFLVSKLEILYPPYNISRRLLSSRVYVGVVTFCDSGGGSCTSAPTSAPMMSVNASAAGTVSSVFKISTGSLLLAYVTIAFSVALFAVICRTRYRPESYASRSWRDTGRLVAASESAATLQTKNPYKKSPLPPPPLPPQISPPLPLLSVIDNNTLREKNNAAAFSAFSMACAFTGLVVDACVTKSLYSYRNSQDMVSSSIFYAWLSVWGFALFFNFILVLLFLSKLCILRPNRKLESNAGVLAGNPFASILLVVLSFHNAGLLEVHGSHWSSHPTSIFALEIPRRLLTLIRSSTIVNVFLQFLPKLLVLGFSSMLAGCRSNFGLIDSEYVSPSGDCTSIFSLSLYAAIALVVNGISLLVCFVFRARWICCSVQLGRALDEQTDSCESTWFVTFGGDALAILSSKAEKVEMNRPRPEEIEYDVDQRRTIELLCSKVAAFTKPHTARFVSLLKENDQAALTTLLPHVRSGSVDVHDLQNLAYMHMCYLKQLQENLNSDISGTVELILTSEVENENINLKNPRALAISLADELRTRHSVSFLPVLATQQARIKHISNVTKAELMAIIHAQQVERSSILDSFSELDDSQLQILVSSAFDERISSVSPEDIQAVQNIVDNIPPLLTPKSGESETSGLEDSLHTYLESKHQLALKKMHDDFESREKMAICDLIKTSESEFSISIEHSLNFQSDDFPIGTKIGEVFRTIFWLYSMSAVEQHRLETEQEAELRHHCISHDQLRAAYSKSSAVASRLFSDGLRRIDEAHRLSLQLLSTKHLSQIDNATALNNSVTALCYLLSFVKSSSAVQQAEVTSAAKLVSPEAEETIDSGEIHLDHLNMEIEALKCTAELYNQHLKEETARELVQLRGELSAFSNATTHVTEVLALTSVDLNEDIKLLSKLVTSRSEALHKSNYARFSIRSDPIFATLPGHKFKLTDSPCKSSQQLNSRLVALLKVMLQEQKQIDKDFEKEQSAARSVYQERLKRSRNLCMRQVRNIPPSADRKDLQEALYLHFIQHQKRCALIISMRDAQLNALQDKLYADVVNAATGFVVSIEAEPVANQSLYYSALLLQLNHLRNLRHEEFGRIHQRSQVARSSALNSLIAKMTAQQDNHFAILLARAKELLASRLTLTPVVASSSDTAADDKVNPSSKAKASAIERSKVEESLYRMAVNEAQNVYIVAEKVQTDAVLVV